MDCYQRTWSRNPSYLDWWSCICSLSLCSQGRTCSSFRNFGRTCWTFIPWFQGWICWRYSLCCVCFQNYLLRSRFHGTSWSSQGIRLETQLWRNRSYVAWWMYHPKVWISWSDVLVSSWEISPMLSAAIQTCPTSWLIHSSPRLFIELFHVIVALFHKQFSLVYQSLVYHLHFHSTMVTAVLNFLPTCSKLNVITLVPTLTS